METLNTDNQTSQNLKELKELVKDKIEINQKFNTLLPYDINGVNLEQDTTGIAAFFKKDGFLDGADSCSRLHITYNLEDSLEDSIIYLLQEKHDNKLYTYYNYNEQYNDKEVIKQNNKIKNISEFITDKISDYVAEELSKKKQIEQILSKIDMEFWLYTSRSIGIYKYVYHGYNTINFVFDSGAAAQSMESYINELQNFGTVLLYCIDEENDDTLIILNVKSRNNTLCITVDIQGETDIKKFSYIVGKARNSLRFIIINNGENQICSLKEKHESEGDKEKHESEGDHQDEDECKTATVEGEKEETSAIHSQPGKQIEQIEESNKVDVVSHESKPEESTSNDEQKEGNKVKESKPEETSETQKEDIEKGSTNNVDNDSNNRITEGIGNCGPQQDKNEQKQGDEDQKKQQDTENNKGNDKISKESKPEETSETQQKYTENDEGNEKTTDIESEEDVETGPDLEGENYQESNKNNDKTIKKKNNKSWFATNAWTCIGVGVVALTSGCLCYCWYAFKKDPKQSTLQGNQQKNTGNHTIMTR